MYVLIYVFISKYCQYYSDFIRCQAKLVHTIFIYIVLVLFISFQRPRPEIQELYIRYIYYIYIIYIRSKCTLLLQHFKFYLFLLFSITPPPLSSFDLLFWLGGGGLDAKSSWAREHCSERTKKNFWSLGGSITGTYDKMIRFSMSNNFI